MKPDKELVQAVLAGNVAEFNDLVLRYRQPLLRVSVRFTKDMPAAEDVVQEALIKAFERLHLFEGRATFKSWLFQIAINTAKNRLRGGSRRESVNIDDVDLVTVRHAEHSLSQTNLEQRLKDEVNLLPTRQRLAVSLRIFEELTFQEVAEIMECPYDTAKANFRHGLTALRDRLSEDLGLKSWMDALRQDEAVG